MFDFSNYSPESNYYNDLKKLIISNVKKNERGAAAIQ